MRRLALAALVTLLLPGVATPCTGIYVFQNGRALAGNNEDFWNPDTKVWFVPREEGRHGRIYFGFGNLFPQGGMNTAGLFFDGFATKRLPMTGMAGRDKFAGNLIDEAMATCGSVDEVKALFGRYDLSFLETAMLMFGDRHGESIIVEGDLVLDKEGRDQVVTNFYQSESAPEAYTCKRYEAARRRLDRTKRVTVERMEEALKEVSVNNGKVATQYSNVYELSRGVVHLYHFQDFKTKVTLDLEEELKKGARVVELPSLFPRTKRFARFEAARKAEIEEKKEARLATDVDPAMFLDYEGTYHVDFGAGKTPLLVTREDDALFLSAPSSRGERKVELLPEGEGKFFHVDYDGTTGFRFVRDDEGDVTGLEYTSILGHRYEGVKQAASGAE